MVTDMARRVAGIVTAIGFWSIGTMLLVGAAGFLFAAALHRAGSDGWLIATVGTVALSVTGGVSLAIGWWLATYRSPVSRSGAGPVPASDDEMWIV
jgi:hypothetical protein